MDKDEILTRAQREGRNGIDDGSAQVKNKGLRYGVSVVYALYLLYLILAWYKDTSLPFVAQSMFMALVTGDALSCWKDRHTFGSLALLVLASVVTIGVTVAGIMQLFGK